MILCCEECVYDLLTVQRVLCYMVLLVERSVDYTLVSFYVFIPFGWFALNEP